MIIIKKQIRLPETIVKAYRVIIFSTNVLSNMQRIKTNIFLIIT